MDYSFAHATIPLDMPSILEQIIDSQNGTLSPEVARYLLTLEFPERLQQRHLELQQKVEQTTLSPEEQIELDEYLNANALLMILQSKARVSLRKHTTAA